MKKFFAITLSIITLSLAAVTAEAKAPAPQFGHQMERGRQNDRHRGRDWNHDRFNRPVRVFTQTNYSRMGGRFFKDTYLVTVFRNGRTERRLISRVRVR